MIRTLRHKQRSTLEQVSKEIGISTSALGMYERGMRTPDLKTLMKISKFFEVDINYFYDASYEEVCELSKLLHRDNFPADEVEYAKKRAAGNCELCGNRAPFFTNNGEPYLEIHNIEKEREETKIGIVMLCPNCHKRIEILNSKGEVSYLKNIVEKDRAKNE